MKGYFFLILFLTILIIPNPVEACYKIYNISLEGELGEGVMNIRKVQNLESYKTNCLVSEEYLVCNETFYFYGISKPHSEPFVFDEYDFPHDFQKTNEYLEYFEGEHTLKAKEIINNTKSYLNATLKILEWVNSNIHYSDNFYTTTKTFLDRRGNCESMSFLSVQMLRSIGIPSRVAFGWKGNEQHAWVEIYYPSGEWFSADSTYGRYGYLGDDYLLIGYNKEDYITSPKFYDYNFTVLEIRGCGVFLRKRGDFLYNKHANILTYKTSEYGSFPLLLKEGYIKKEEIRGIDWEENFIDKFLGLVLKLKSFLNKE